MFVIFARTFTRFFFPFYLVVYGSSIWWVHQMLFAVAEVRKMTQGLAKIYLQITVFVRAVDLLRSTPTKSTQSTCNGQLVTALWHVVHLFWTTWILHDITRVQVLNRYLWPFLWQPYFDERLCLLKLSKWCLHDRGRANKSVHKRKLRCT